MISKSIHGSARYAINQEVSNPSWFFDRVTLEEQVDVKYLDVSKAFDIVSHEIS